MKRFLSFSVLFLHLIGALSSVQAGPLGGNWAKVGDSFKHFSPKLADPDSRADVTPQTCKSIITTVAGGGKSPILNDGVQQATTVDFGYPSGVITDADGIYINDNGAGFIDKVDASGVISIAHDMNGLVEGYKPHIVSIAVDSEKNLYVVSAVEAGVGSLR